jgi:hypothetical protein
MLNLKKMMSPVRSQSSVLDYFEAIQKLFMFEPCLVMSKKIRINFFALTSNGVRSQLRYVYMLMSGKSSRWHIGSTKNLQKRILSFKILFCL